MCGKWFIFAGFLLAAHCVNADASLEKVILNDVHQEIEDNAPRGNVIWRPSVGIFTRFEFDIPRGGIGQAVKYQDTSSLFYLSQQRDLGLGFATKNSNRILLSTDPEKIRLNYFYKIQPEIYFKIGISVQGQKISPMFGVDYLRIKNNLSVENYSLNLQEQGTQLGYTRTTLDSLDKYETLMFVEADTALASISAGIGRRWFDLIGRQDLVLSTDFQNGSVSMSVQIEKAFDSGLGYVSLRKSFDSGELSGVLGLNFNLNDMFSFKYNTNSSGLWPSMYTLKDLRRSSLPKLWRSNISLF